MKKMRKTILSVSAVAAASLFVVSLSSCGDKSLTEITGISFDQETGKLSWDKASVAEKYNVLINGKSVAEATDNTSVDIDAAALELAEGTDAKIEIEGLDGKDNVVAEIDTALKVLPNVQISIVDGYYDWSATSNEFNIYATDGYSVAYTIVVDNVVKVTSQTETKFKVEAGEHSIGVKPILVDNSLFLSNYTYEGTKSLATPQNINYDENKVAWSEVDFFNTKATYSCTVNAKLNDGSTVDKTFDTHTNSFDITNVFENSRSITELKVKVQAVSSEEGILTSAVSDEYRFIQLAKVSDVRIDGDNLLWEPVEAATGYQIEVNGKVVATVKEAKYVLGGNVSSDIRVRAIDETATASFAPWSAYVSARTLAKPIIEFNYNNIVWSEISNAGSYYLEVTKYNSEGEELGVVFSNNINKTTLLTPGKYCQETGIYKFKVSACPTVGSDYSRSDWSNELEVVRLGTAMNFRITESDPRNPEGNVQVSLQGIYAGAKYEFKLGGISQSESLDGTFTILKPFTAYTKDDNESYTGLIGTIHAEPKSQTSLNDKLYLPAFDDMTINFAQLKTPSNLYFESTETGDYIVWDRNENATGYGIQLGSRVYTCPQPESGDTVRFEIPQEVLAGNFTARVFAAGANIGDYNDKSTSLYSEDYEYTPDMTVWLTSSYTSPIMFKKLSTPDEVRFDVETSTIQWNDVDDKTGYKVYVYPADNDRIDYTLQAKGVDKINTNAIDTYTIEDLFIELNVNAIAIVVKAVGNKEDSDGSEKVILDSDLTENAFILRKLANPEIQENGLNIVWNAVDHAKGYDILVDKYEDENFYGFNYDYTEDNFYAWTDAHDLEGGFYRIRVRAVASLSEGYFYSLESNEVSFTKLDTPYVIHDEKDPTAYFIPFQEGTTRFEINISANSNVYNDADEIVINDNTVFEMIDINGVPTKCVKYVPHFVEELTNPTITIRAVGNGAEYMASNLYTFTQKTRKISSPLNPVVNANYDDTELVITADVENPYGLGYIFRINNINYYSDSNTYKYSVQVAGTYTIKVGYQGNVFIAENETDLGQDYIYYYSSASSDTGVEIKYLAAPRGDVSSRAESDEENYYYKITWTAIPDGQYMYKTYVLDGTTKIEETETDLIDAGTNPLLNLKVAKSFKTQYTGKILVIEVYSVGNDIDGNGTIISNPTPTIFKVRL